MPKAIEPLMLMLTATLQSGEAPRQTASYYATGEVTANGEAFDPSAMTAAHRSYAFGTMLRITNMDNGREIVVRINDRGPFIEGRDIDLTIGAAQKLGMLQDGTAMVKVTRISRS